MKGDKVVELLEIYAYLFFFIKRLWKRYFVFRKLRHCKLRYSR